MRGIKSIIRLLRKKIKGYIDARTAISLLIGLMIGLFVIGLIKATLTKSAESLNVNATEILEPIQTVYSNVKVVALMFVMVIIVGLAVLLWRQFIGGE